MASRTIHTYIGQFTTPINITWTKLIKIITMVDSDWWGRDGCAVTSGSPNPVLFPPIQNSLGCGHLGALVQDLSARWQHAYVEHRVGQDGWKEIDKGHVIQVECNLDYTELTNV